MCGFLVSINNKFSSKELNSALKLLNHRGPDNSQSLIINENYFGHTRLAIIDLDSRSNQPFQKKSYLIVYNGEIYNYLELIKEHDLKVETASDTEVVLEMYIKYGEKCLEYFNGMFAFIIYNMKTQDTFVARDRLGIKPLYYYKANKICIYASEIAPIQNLVNEKFDEFGIRQYRKLRMTIKGHTIYNNINMLEGGHYFYNDKLFRYWDLKIDKKPIPTDDELKETIFNSIQIRKRSDVSVGSFLSGGLDSTILSHILKPNDTWSVGFKNHNEFKWGELANKSISSCFNKIVINEIEFLDAIKIIIDRRKEPLSVPNEVMIFFMSKYVKHKNTVVLSGEGADELFYGYDRIFKWAFNQNKNINIKDFDEKYCYGTNKDDEIIDYALSGLPGLSVLDKISYFFQIHHLHGLLRRLDSSTMLCSIEARVPFVDHNLIELVTGTPFNWRLNEVIKAPLKRIFYNDISFDIINRKKVGFPAPLDKIFYQKVNKGNTFMDKWLIYNLKEVGYYN